MGDFTLGCLLGQYDKAQSFDVDSASPFVPGSWGLSSSLLLMKNPVSNVHSSAQGIRLDVASFGATANVAVYDYGYDNDAYARWFPDVTTHDVQTRFWAGLFQAADSGAMIMGLNASGAGTVPIGHYGDPNPVMRKHFISTFVHSTGAAWPRFQVRVDPSQAQETEIVLDDVLTEIDPITLNPEYSFLEQARLNESRHRTQGGKLYNYVWSKHFAYRVPLRYITDSHAATINWWWEKRFNLAFTLDTSDSESTHVCRIVNDRQPIGKRIKPYADLWEGMIELESIDQGSLVF